MDNYNIYTCKNDLLYNKKDIDYKTILFENINNRLKKIVKKYLSYYLNSLNIKKGDSIFIVGLGNDNYTADSIGPKTLKYIKVNAYIKNFNINNKTLIYALEPGTLSETGILTENIIKNITNDIKPNLIILIDSFVSNNIDYLNKTIEIRKGGLNTGIGIKGINSNIDEELLHTPIISIGITTALEIKFSNSDINYVPYILSTKDIDLFVNKISKLIGESIQETIDDLN